MQSLTEKEDEVFEAIEFPKSEIVRNIDTVGQNSNDINNEYDVHDNTFLSNIPKDPSIDLMNEATLKNKYMMSIAQVNSEDCGVPLSIFDNVCKNYFKCFF